MAKPSITIAVQCHNFQRRLSWMLSSLVDQVNRDDYNLVFDLAYVEEESDPSMKIILERFAKEGIFIRERIYTGFDRFQYRGLVRNDQLKDCSTDFMIFADSDMVYHKEFIHKLVDLMNNDSQYKGYGGILMAGRFSNPISDSNALVDSRTYSEDPYVTDSWDSASTLKKIKRRSCGAGYFQLIDAKTCEHGGLYVAEKSCRDYGWYDGKNNMQKARSDRQFRRRVKIKKQLPDWFHQGQIHLNHDRDNEHGSHLENQR
jgi:hypothetical protein